MEKQKHLVIVRSGGSIINFSSYNCQELGLAKALSAKGWKVSIILAGLAYEEKIIKVNGGKDVTVFSVEFLALNQQLAWFKGIDRLLQKLNPDIIQIHEFGMWMSYKVTKWALRHKVNICLIQGSYHPTQKPIFKQLEQLFNSVFGKYVLSHVNCIGCKSIKAEEYIHKYSPKKCFPTYIGLDDSRFLAAEDKDWRQRIGLENKYILLYVGVIEPRRNPLFLLEIIEKLPDDYTLLIVGDGPLSKELSKIVKEKYLEKKCKLLGRLKQEELPSLYKTADLFLLPSDYEIYGMVILESMYFGTPVISTLTAGSEALIAQWKNGVIIPNKDVVEWNKTIIKLCSDSVKLADISAAASKKIANELVWDKASERFIELYQSCCDQ